mmetsp:Transcript_5179/g.3637  ORF Transcript_5179/g.3637 Transcript_5179/m.3637 type:complete len:102 (+) Transcript_5179:577-882(+)
MNTLNVRREGTNTLKLKDGTHYTIDNPKCEVWGLVNKEKVCNMLGTMTIIDHTNDIICEVVYNPHDFKVGFTTRIPGFGNAKTVKKLPEEEKNRDFIHINI